MPYHKAMSSVIRQRPDFHTLSSSEVLDEFVAMRILDKTADNAVMRSQRLKKPNLALKAKASVEEEDEEEDEESNPKDTKYDYHEHMALASRQFWTKKNSRPNFNNNNSSGFKGKQCVRTCYNCGNVSHFVVDLREAGRQWWQAHPKRQSQVLPQQEQLHQEDSNQRVGGTRRIQ